MTPLLIAAALWVLAGAAMAILPLRLQIAPGVVLLLAAPVLLGLLAREYGAIAFALALAAVLSMFRRPALALWRCLRGAGR